MQPLTAFSAEARRRIVCVATDIDDTLTSHGRLPAVAYGALERLRAAGLRVVPVTGRPAGWCDHIARMWPVDGVVGENGAFYFRHDDARRRMTRRYWLDADTRRENRRRLDAIAETVLAAVPGAAIAADQAYREADLAIDFAEDVGPLPDAAVAQIVAAFERAGATAKVSSIHVNGWYGDYDKLTMTLRLLDECLGLDAAAARSGCLFVGDSPNDAPMFAHFAATVGVANVARFADVLPARPRWITRRPGGEGFAELAEALLAARR